MRIPLLLIVLSCSIQVLRAQEFERVNPSRQQLHTGDVSRLSPLERLEDSLVFIADSMYLSSLDERRIDAGYEFIRLMKNWLKTPGSFKWAAKKLKEKIVILDAPDGNFRIYNWEIVRNPIEKRYYGSIQTRDNQIIPLVDVSDQVVRGAEDSLFGQMRWYGCLYYQIVKKEVQGKPYYYLLGWNGNSINSERKLMEVLHFDGSQAVFGADHFTVLERGKTRNSKRHMLEYQKGSHVMYNFDSDRKDLVVFDHCESQIGDPAKKYTYIPDGTYDGLRWTGDRWIMEENVVNITPLKDGEAPVDKAINR